MPRSPRAKTAEHLPPLSPAASPRLTTIVPCLVGHTVEEVERELILNSLAHYSGNRTWAANVLGISVRTLRNKINEYAAQGIAVPAPSRPRFIGPTPRVPMLEEFLRKHSPPNAVS
jgi:two-component system, response regulator FlrC